MVCSFVVRFHDRHMIKLEDAEFIAECMEDLLDNTKSMQFITVNAAGWKKTGPNEYTKSSSNLKVVVDTESETVSFAPLAPGESRTSFTTWQPSTDGTGRVFEPSPL